MVFLDSQLASPLGELTSLIAFTKTTTKQENRPGGSLNLLLISAEQASFVRMMRSFKQENTVNATATAVTIL